MIELFDFLMQKMAKLLKLLRDIYTILTQHHLAQTASILFRQHHQMMKLLNYGTSRMAKKL